MGRDNKTSLTEPREKPLQRIINTGKFQICLPEVFGFCGGVLYAISLMEETIQTNIGKRIFLLGEIIHNKNVNDYFVSKGVEIIKHEELEKIFTLAKEEDSIVIPAFGIVKELEERIRKSFKNVVDTTCKDVKKVWKFIEEESEKGSTILIHGHLFHPEVEASISRALHNSTVIVIQNKEEAEVFLKGELKSCDYALANQTTMLYSETCQIEKYLRAELAKKNLNLNACQSICKATYMRQFAAEKLLSDKSIDIVFVVGGYDSSNTNNLYKLSKEKHNLTFYIKDASSLNSALFLEHYIPSKKETEQIDLSPIFPAIKKLAILAGASCPVSLVEAVIRKLSFVAGK